MFSTLSALITLTLAATSAQVSAAPLSVPSMDLSKLFGFSAALSPACQSALLPALLPVIQSCQGAGLLEILKSPTTLPTSLLSPDSPFLPAFCSDACSAALSGFVSRAADKCVDQALFDAIPAMTTPTPPLTVENIAAVIGALRPSSCVPSKDAGNWCIVQEATQLMSNASSVSLNDVFALFAAPSSLPCVGDQYAALQAAMTQYGGNPLLQAFLPVVVGAAGGVAPVVAGVVASVVSA